MMKRLFSMLLLIFLLTTALASCTKTAESTDAKTTPGSSAVGSTLTDGTSDPTTETGSDSAIETATPTTGEEDYTAPNFVTLTPASGSASTHQALTELPSYATLVGSDTLPPIDNQGGIGCCASNAITYMQYTNAVAQYVKHHGGLGDWSPSTDTNQCYSPKFTYQFAGASTSNVYTVLIDHGALKNYVDGFAKDASGGSQSKIGGQFQKQTLKWSVFEGYGDEALDYRLLNYEQTFVTNNSTYSVPGVAGVAMTTSEGGRAMIEKIKEAIASGNVVVTGGYPNTWQSQRVTSASGTLAKGGDYVITYATNDRSGGHQVCIVAYDDEMTVKANGITMKGAFLIANSWGTTWGKNGYMWIMYDALNSVSEFEDFTLPASMVSKGVARDWALDQFCFMYWDSDITPAKPELYAEVELTTANRDAFSMQLTRTDAMGQSETITPYMFTYLDMHEKYDVSGYLNADGDINGEAVNGFYTVSFGRLYNIVPEGTTYKDFEWTIKITSSASDSPVTLKSLKLKDSTGETVCNLSFGEGETFTRTSRTYKFGFFESAARSKSFLTGLFTLENAASGKYIAKDGAMMLKTDSAKNAASILIALDAEQNIYNLMRDDERYVIEAVDGLSEGVAARFNAKDPVNRGATQNWQISYNDDGTYSFYLTTEKGVCYALADVNGVPCLTKAVELNDSVKWIAHPTSENTTDTDVTIDGSTLTVSGQLKDNADSVLIVITDETGKEVARKEASVTGKSYSEAIEVTSGGTLLVKILDSKGETIVGTNYVVIK